MMMTKEMRSLAAGVSLVAMVAGLAGCSALPAPLTDMQLSERVTGDLDAMFADQEPVTGPIDLDEAIARGLKYNLDKKLKHYERSMIEAGNATIAAGMLPQLAASAGYRGRDSFRGSTSQSLATGVTSLAASTSEDKELYTADLAGIWNVLDFGLTWLKSKQEADRVLIAEERRLKVTQNVVLDIRDAYWRSVAAERMLPRVNNLVARVELGIAASKRVQKSGTGEPADELKLQRELLVALRDLTEVKRRLSLAKAELAALMNLPRGQKFALAMPSGKLHTPRVQGDIRALEESALRNRPELREEDYKKRISLTEVDAAWVRLLPGLELRAGVNYDSNSFLVTHDWSDASAVLTKNLTELITAPRAITYAEADVTVADNRRMALSMAVIAQLHIALQRHAMAEDVFRASKRLYDVDKELGTIADDGEAADAAAEAEVLSALARRTVSELHFYTAYSDVQNAHARILNSLGLPRPPEGIEALPLADLRTQVHSMLTDWQGSVGPLQVASN